jgi:hypothetical protein
MSLIETLPGGTRVTRSRARVIRPALERGERVQQVVECFSPHMAASTWPVLPLFVLVLFAGLPFDLFVAGIVLAFGAAMFRLTTYLVVATDRSLLLVRYGKLVDGQRGRVVKRLPRTSRIGKPYIFSFLGLDVPPGLWQLPVQHELHLRGPLFLGLRLDGATLWTPKGNKRRIKQIDVMAA